jgi:hypothetical protein
MTNGWSANFNILHSVIAYFKCLFLYRNAFFNTFIAYSLSEPFFLHLKTLPNAPWPKISIISNDLKFIPYEILSSNNIGIISLTFTTSSGSSSTLSYISFILYKSWVKLLAYYYSFSWSFIIILFSKFWLEELSNTSSVVVTWAHYIGRV